MSQVQLNPSQPQNNEKALLRVEDLGVTFKRQKGLLRKITTDVKAIDHVSFSLLESETLSVVGESGSGKTTLARCIMRFALPTSGSIFYNGVDVTKLKGKELLQYRREVQMIFQDPFSTLNPRQDVLTSIMLPIRRLLGEKDPEAMRKSAYRIIEEVGLDPAEVAHRFPHQLSGGQRQRVNIARALAPNPKLLIADEPITMLDSEQRLNILSLLRSLKSKRNLTILMITHDLASAKLFSQRMLIMYMGKSVEEGPTKSILSKPFHPYVELIMSAMPGLENATEITGETDISSSIDESASVSQGCIFRPRCNYATGICSDVEPPLTEKSSAHWAACHNPLNTEESGH